ncbi:SDR family oxidoreductase [Bradyrhizobium genosp. SA-3]|uniref:SDR family oxidoreductase n=1 Tax=Bradyrhizobium genosp. SA-3 TaxID=508868 RepID=UPI0013EED1F0|nr:SDR family oxidoreductase [Bradyrhizobium genosp. SA-3]
MSEHKEAVVVGALGVIGRYIVERLLRQDDWSVIGLSRRAVDAVPRYRHISVDLLDREDVEVKLAGLTEATHVFYASFQPAAGAAAGYASNVAPNRDMLINAVTAIDNASSALRRVVLVTGTKYYGSHLGPFKTPARESDPRHMGPNYYFEQIDWLAAFQCGKRWDWVELRPQTLCGFAPGTPMSLAGDRGLRRDQQGAWVAASFPGKPGAYTSIYQVTESAHFANAALWAASTPRCGLEAFNITNGDYFRWKNLWPKLAAAFDMLAGDVQTISLTAHMVDNAPLWRVMTEKYGLKRYAYDELAAARQLPLCFVSDRGCVAAQYVAKGQLRTSPCRRGDTANSSTGSPARNTR